MTIGLEEIKDHVGHKIACVMYGKEENYTIECETCSMVLFDSEGAIDTFYSYYDTKAQFERHYHTIESHAKRNGFVIVVHKLETGEVLKAVNV